VGGKQAYVSGSLTSPYFEFISDPIFSPDGETLACRAKNGESWHLTIGRWSSESYDEVFAPQFTEDGLAVTCAVRIGLDLFRLTVPIDSIER
jgi:hypothetical protein